MPKSAVKAAKQAFKPEISDDAVKAKTGKAWSEWFAILDKAGAQKMPHKEIARLLYDKHKVPGWWCQMVTVTYEQARGLRVKQQSCFGDFQASASRVIAAPIEEVFKSFHDAKLRKKWLPDAPLEITTATLPKSIRGKWTEGDTRFDVNLYSKGPAKTQIGLGHTKLPDAAAAQKMKAYWGSALDRLRERLEAK